MPARYMRKGVTRFWWVPTIAAATRIPTVAELTAGTEITGDLAEISGFSFENSPISTPDMSSTFTKQIDGEDTAADSSMTMYEDKTGTEVIRLALAKGNSGYVVIFPKGTAGASPAIADKVDTWPAKIAARTRTYSAGNEAAQYVVNYAITDVPKFDLAIIA